MGISGTHWAADLCKDASVDDVLEHANETLMKSKAGRIKMRETALRTAWDKFRSITTLLAPSVDSEALRQETEKLFLQYKAIRLEVKLCKIMEATPQLSKQRKAFKDLHGEFADWTLEAVVAAPLWKEFSATLPKKGDECDSLEGGL